MPVSKRRKKKGKVVKRGSDRLTGLTLQDLINVVAYQQTHPQGQPESADPGEQLSDVPTAIDFEDPTAQAVIEAVSDASRYNKEG